MAPEAREEDTVKWGVAVPGCGAKTEGAHVVRNNLLSSFTPPSGTRLPLCNEAKAPPYSSREKQRPMVEGQ